MIRTYDDWKNMSYDDRLTMMRQITNIVYKENPKLFDESRELSNAVVSQYVKTAYNDFIAHPMQLSKDEYEEIMDFVAKNYLKYYRQVQAAKKIEKRVKGTGPQVPGTGKYKMKKYASAYSKSHAPSVDTSTMNRMRHSIEMPGYTGGAMIHTDYLEHHGIKGQKWGVRRYQNPDGTLTEAGKKRYAQEKERGGSLDPNSWDAADRKQNKKFVTGMLLAKEFIGTGAWIASGAGAPAVAAMLANPALGAATIGTVGLALAGEVALGRAFTDSIFEKQGKRAEKKFYKQQKKKDEG